MSLTPSRERRGGKGESAEPMLPPPRTSLSSSQMAGTKRSAAALLPPFEPLSSSPALPRPFKRQTREDSIKSRYVKYPTPVPTSSTCLFSSSPPRHGPVHEQNQADPASHERAPLSAVPAVGLNEKGEILRMGRSSNSSEYQLSTNRLISRVHVTARYIPATEDKDSNQIEIVCTGSNGCKVSCGEKSWLLGKGDSFVSETERVELMLDVCDARVRIQWPGKVHRDGFELSWDASPRTQPSRGVSVTDSLDSSPLARQQRVHSPESPTPLTRSFSSRNALFPGGDADETVQIYEDPEENEEEQGGEEKKEEEEEEGEGEDEPKLTEISVDAGESFAQTEMTNSFSSDLSEPENDPDEENDPIVHSFGPFGANIASRMAAITADSPHDSSREQSQEPSKPSTTPLSSEPDDVINPDLDISAITNHVVNQLAYSRLSSNPLTAIMNNLPAEEKKDMKKTELRQIIESAKCIGIIPRQGKDAAGKPLESEYYYIPEHDRDDSRRLAVTDGLRKPSLRACRKQHKQYYWKRPKTP